MSACDVIGRVSEPRFPFLCFSCSVAGAHQLIRTNEQQKLEAYRATQTAEQSQNGSLTPNKSFFGTVQLLTVHILCSHLQNVFLSVFDATLHTQLQVPHLYHCSGDELVAHSPILIYITYSDK